MTLIEQYHSHNLDFIDSTHSNILIWKEFERKSHPATFYAIILIKFFFHMIYIIEGEGALVNEAGEETQLKAGDFALVTPDERHQYRNKGDKPFKMICRVPKEFE